MLDTYEECGAVVGLSRHKDTELICSLPVREETLKEDEGATEQVYKVIGLSSVSLDFKCPVKQPIAGNTLNCEQPGDITEHLVSQILPSHYNDNDRNDSCQHDKATKYTQRYNATHV